MAVNKGLVTVEVDASRILAKLAPSLYRRAVGRFIGMTALTVQRAAQGATPTDMGALRRAWVADVRPLSARVYNPLAYAATVDQGRRAGARPPPPEALVGWMARHGLAGVSPFVLARAIARRGTKGRFMVKAGVEAARNAAPRLLGIAAREVERAWGRS